MSVDVVWYDMIRDSICYHPLKIPRFLRGIIPPWVQTELQRERGLNQSRDCFGSLWIRDLAWPVQSMKALDSVLRSFCRTRSHGRPIGFNRALGISTIRATA